MAGPALHAARCRPTSLIVACCSVVILAMLWLQRIPRPSSGEGREGGEGALGTPKPRPLPTIEEVLSTPSLPPSPVIFNPRFVKTTATTAGLCDGPAVTPEPGAQCDSVVFLNNASWYFPCAVEDTLPLCVVNNQVRGV
jgi:hypothetical protein